MKHLASAIPYSEGNYPDKILREAVDVCRSRGMRVAGVIQHRRESRHRCDMLLEDLASGHFTPLLDARGKQATGCMLNSIALADSAIRVLNSIDERTRLLVINKFGKAEIEGGGMREAIVAAVTSDVPVLVAVPLKNAEQWRKFAGEFTLELYDSVALANWLDNVVVFSRNIGR